MKHILFFFALFFVISLTAQNDGVRTFNLDFDKKAFKRDLPDGWLKWGTDNFNVVADAETRQAGRYAVCIFPQGDQDSTSFGSVAYQLPAYYQGSTIELEGYMKLENVQDGFAGLLLRLDGRNGPIGFDNMQERQINGTREWEKYSVKLAFSEDVKSIFIGGLHTGSGKVWFDSFRVLIDGKDLLSLTPVKPKTSKADLDAEFLEGSRIQLSELTERQLEDLSLLAKVWGFLKYYHPTVAKGEVNWDFELFRIMPKVLESSSKKKNPKDAR